jgi:alpha-galactosidase
MPALAQKFPGLAQTPPMGWNTWNKFACNVSEVLIRDAADAMVTSGMKDAGYQYINIDDCWHGERDANGFIRPDPQRFPSGMKALSDYVHSKGLKLGIYSDAGWKTCGGKPGSRGHEYQDAQTYAQWGIDYLKYDWCNTEGLAAPGAYLTMREALHAAGRPIVFSICEWGDSKPWEWAQDVGHLWRTTGDIYPCFDCIIDHGTWKTFGVLQILDMQAGKRPSSGPGHWNDPDMLEVGNGLSPAEERAHFSMWAMLSAPLIAGNDLKAMSKDTRAVLTNHDVIAVDQDALGIPAFRHSASDGIEIWFKPLEQGEWAMAVLNRNSARRDVTFDWSRASVSDGLSKRDAHFDRDTYTLDDLWAHRRVGDTRKTLTLKLEAHDIAMYRLTP